jgi:hypothetical protein
MKMQTRFVAALIGVFMAAASLQARQDPAKPAPPPKAPAKVDVVVSRSLAGKKTSTLPFTLLVTSNGSYTNLRVGVDVPIGTTTTTRAAEGNREGSSTTTPSYRSIGTNIDCRVTSTPDGRFDVGVSISDSSIFSADQDARASVKSADPAAFRTFTTNNTLLMKDGQTMLFATATDKVSGELLEIHVTFTLIK